jgi:hypothetical protein
MNITVGLPSVRIELGMADTEPRLRGLGKEARYVVTVTPSQ